MNIVQRHIQYLAATTDCVIIPGWGGLLASHCPAYVDGNRFMPPSRTMVFNPALTHDDGLLAASISRHEGISYEAAKTEIESETAAMRAAFEATGYVALPRIGIFRRKDSSTVFEPDLSGVAGARYAYLPPLPVASPVATATGAAPAAHVVRRESIGRRILRVAAFVAILLGLAITLSNPISVNLDRRTDFAGIGVCSIPATQPATQPDPILVLVVPDPEIGSAPVAEKPAVEIENPRCYLIIGSFDSMRDAERWIAGRSQESNLGIIERSGRFRVYAATGATIAEASRLKADPDFAARNPEAWVYVRR